MGGALLHDTIQAQRRRYAVILPMHRGTIETQINYCTGFSRATHQIMAQ